MLRYCVLGALLVAFLGAAVQAQPGDYEQQRALAQFTACKSNLKNLGTALEMWSTDNRGRYPARLGQLAPSYLRTIPTCPAAQRDTYSASYRMRANPDCYAFLCQGANHRLAGIPADFPKYDSQHGLVSPESTVTSNSPASRVLSPALRVLSCKSNLKNLGTALEMWSTDNRGNFPAHLGQVAPNYVRAIPTCPAAQRDTYSASYRMRANPNYYAFFCQGANHTSEGYPANFPRYTSDRGLQDR